MLGAKLILSLTLIIFWSGEGCAQDSLRTQKKTNNLFTSRHHFYLAYETESGFGNGAATGYVYNPDRQRKYYVGLQIKALAKNTSQPLNVTSAATSAFDGLLKTTTNTVCLDVLQRYTIITEDHVRVFLGLDLGWRSTSQQITSSYTYNSGFPFGWVPGGDFISRGAKSVYSADFGLGASAIVYKEQTMNLRIGLKHVGPFDYINTSSVRYNGASLNYPLQASPGAMLTFTLEFMF